jgi:hypothetical protein
MLTIRVPGATTELYKDHEPTLIHPSTRLLVTPEAPVRVVSEEQSGTFPPPAYIPPPRPRVGLLYWPGFGASRFAFAHYVIDGHTLERMKLGFEEQGDNAVELRFTDRAADPEDEEEPRVFKMYLLESRPLADTGEDDPDPTLPATGVVQGFLCTFVDQRYYWQFRQGGGGAVDASSWAALFDSLSAGIGVGLTGEDTPAAAYGTPDAGRWTDDLLDGIPSVFLMDAALALVNFRLVVDPATEAITALDATGVASAIAMWDADQPRLAGGAITPETTRLGMVEEVEVISAATGVSTVAPVPDGQATGQVVILTDTGGTGYANKFATDWGVLQQAPLDAVYLGFVQPPMAVMPFVGHLELTHTADRGLTVLRRPPCNYPQLTCSPLPGSGGGTGGCAGCGWVAGLETDDCLRLTIPSGLGRCNCVDPQDVTLVWDGGTGGWVSDEDLESCCGAGPVVFKVETGGEPHLTWGPLNDCDEVEFTYNLTLDCCTDNVAYFTAGGPTLCDGTRVGDHDPAANVMRIRLEVVACTNPDWEGPGWYCATGSEQECGVDPTVPIYLDADPGPGIKLCSGPYPTEAEAEVACPPDEPEVVICGEIEYNIPAVLFFTFTSATGIYAQLLGQTVTLSYDAGTNCWHATPIALDHGCWFTFNFSAYCDEETDELGMCIGGSPSFGGPTTDPPPANSCGSCSGVLADSTDPLQVTYPYSNSDAIAGCAPAGGTFSGGFGGVLTG